MIRSPAWLRRAALGLVLLGVAHVVATFPLYATQWKALAAEVLLPLIWTHVAAGFWVTGSGMLLGMLAESAKDPESVWPGPLARGIVKFLLAGGFLAAALMWSNPFGWILSALSLLSWWAARKVA